MLQPMQTKFHVVHDQLNTDEGGAVFTKVEVVDFIPDLVGYDPQRNLVDKRLLESSCGRPEFVLAAHAAWIAAL